LGPEIFFCHFKIKYNAKGNNKKPTISYSENIIKYNSIKANMEPIIRKCIIIISMVYIIS